MRKTLSYIWKATWYQNLWLGIAFVAAMWAADSARQFVLAAAASVWAGIVAGNVLVVSEAAREGADPGNIELAAAVERLQQNVAEVEAPMAARAATAEEE